MRILQFWAVIGAVANSALAATVEESTKPDGTHTVVTRVLSFALGEHRGAAAAALFVVAIGMVVAAVWLTASRGHTKSEQASQLSVSVPGKGSLKAAFSVPTLLIALAVVLLIIAAFVATLLPVYTATI